MASYPTQELQEQFLDAIRKGQETVIEAVRTWVDTVQSVTPAMPLMPVPFAEQLPKPEEVVAGTYDFAEKLLAIQRQFSEEWVKAAAPLMRGIGERKAGPEA
jgi:hypothetical protein